MSFLALIVWLIWTSNGFAHDATGIPLPMHPESPDAQATDLADVICADDGHGPTSYLFAQVRDDSPPAPGLMVNLQVIKGSQAANTTDPVSGDGVYSEPILLPGGDGVYRMLANKTGPGRRVFSVIWHCMTSDHVHTGTEIQVRQVQ
ncbi:MAG: hypothetical protein N3A55_07535 [Methylohalobius sp.]|nr:hypothetical protein [Methylohalobius sp.]